MSDKLNHDPAPETAARTINEKAAHSDSENANSAPDSQDGNYGAQSGSGTDFMDAQEAAQAGATSPEAGRIVKSSRPVTGAPKKEAGSGQTDTEPEEPAAARGTSGPSQNEPHVEEPGFAPDEELAPGLCARLFRGLAHIGPLVLLVAVGCMVWPDFWQALSGTGYYCPAEGRAIGAFLHAVEQNSWLAPQAPDAGAWLAQLPVHTWYLWLVSLLVTVAGLSQEMLFPLANALAAFLAVFAVWGFSRAAAFGSEAAFASGVILLCAPLFALAPHCVGPMTLASALMLLSLMFFCRGWRHEHGWISLPCGFVLAGLAALCGGLFYLVVPLAASIFFLVWQGRWHRTQRKDSLFGFLLLLVLLGGWISSVILLANSETYLGDIFSSDWDFSWPHQRLWWLVPAIAGMGLTPWILEIFGVSWIRVLAGCGQSLSSSRHENGSAFAWTSLVLACAISPFFSHPVFLATAIVCLAAPLLGKAFMHFSPAGNRLFFFLASLCLIIAGLGMLAGSFSFSRPWILAILPPCIPQNLSQTVFALGSLPIIGGICLLGGLISLFVFARGDHQGGGLVFSLLLTIVLCQPAILMLVPELAANPDMRLGTFNEIESQYKNAVRGAAPVPVPSLEENSPAPEPATRPAGNARPAAPAAAPSGAVPQEQGAAVLPAVETPDAEQTPAGTSGESRGAMQAVPESEQANTTPPAAREEVITELVPVQPESAHTGISQDNAPAAKD